MTLTKPQAQVFEEIQAQMRKNAGVAKMSIWWNERTIAALEKKELIVRVGDEITFHPRRWLHGV